MTNNLFFQNFHYNFTMEWWVAMEWAKNDEFLFVSAWDRLMVLKERLELLKRKHQIVIEDKVQQIKTKEPISIQMGTEVEQLSGIKEFKADLKE